MIDYDEEYFTYDQRMEDLFRSSKAEYDIPPMPKWVGIRVIYPFLGAAARVIFYDTADDTVKVSTYLDIDNTLGYMSGPYIEIYPAKNDDAARFCLEDQGLMYPAILASLKKQRAEKRKAK